MVLMPWSACLCAALLLKPDICILFHLHPPVLWFFSSIIQELLQRWYQNRHFKYAESKKIFSGRNLWSFSGSGRGDWANKKTTNIISLLTNPHPGFILRNNKIFITLNRWTREVSRKFYSQRAAGGVIAVIKILPNGLVRAVWNCIFSLLRYKE